MFKTIVVGHGGSPNADPALAVARSMALREEARIIVVHVIEITAGRGGGQPLYLDEDERRAILDQHVRALNSEGVQAELAVRQTVLSGPAHVIADEADKENADLIVVGTRGYSALAQVLVGGVTLRLLHLSRCPVLVVPSPEQK